MVFRSFQGNLYLEAKVKLVIGGLPSWGEGLDVTYVWEAAVGGPEQANVQHCSDVVVAY